MGQRMTTKAACCRPGDYPNRPAKDCFAKQCAANPARNSASGFVKPQAMAMAGITRGAIICAAGLSWRGEAEAGECRKCRGKT